MKTLIIVLTAFFALGSAVSAQTTATAPKKEVQKTTYSCPMHPKEISDKKGKCSKCGMDLVVNKETVHSTTQKESQTTTVAKSKYVCTMDGATADKPGKCPKCGMALTERKSDKK
ncbi:heavy metal-binding domain-containing protein [Flavobacterium granuli]|uniref:Transcription initiation factor IIE alpha subunit n=1 Tax=Flavobacterium granuli TaxID=280093 RepID=A0ABU1RZA2_9FLAO|nr:heavy metal-binding domain-containing protein [Flavobacterium granuli]MDR6844111.1 transcription initiation factor IIE alpha subunit [Flavobacterium granuli]